MTDRRDDGPPPQRRDAARPATTRAGTLTRRMEALAAQVAVGAPPAVRRAPPAPTPSTAASSRELVALPSPRRAALVPERHSTTGRGDAEFHPHTLAIEDQPRSPISLLVLASLAAMLVSAGAWAWFSRIALYTSSPGKIQTTGRTKVVEALETGKVMKILVRDGDTVAARAPLVELDPTDARAAKAIVAAKLADQRAEVQRSKIEISAARADTIDPKIKIAWSDDVPASVRPREDAVARADLAKLAAQIATLRATKAVREAERDKFKSNIKAQKALVAVTQENLAMIDSLMKSGFNSQAKYLDMKAQLDDQQVMQTSYEGSLANAEQAILMVDSEIAKTREVFVATRTQAISDDEQSVVDLAQQLVRADVRLVHMTLRAAVNGVVHANAVTTVGQVVKPGQQLMQIVPSGADLEIEAYVSNADIGFIRKDDKATVKVDAFTYNVYGAIDATVIDVANDAIAVQGKATLQSASLDGAYGSTTGAEKTGNLQYAVHLHATQSTMTVEGKQIPLVPGMLVTVEIETERLRAIDYVLTPIEVLFSTAGHER